MGNNIRVTKMITYWIQETETEHILMSGYHDEALASISRDPTYGYWSVTGQCEGEFPSLLEAKAFVEEQLHKH